MLKMRLTDFDPGKIASSGQCFRMKEIAYGTYEVIAGSRYLRIGRGCTDGSFIFSCSQKEMDSFWKNYFDFDTDYGEIRRSVDPSDHYLKGAVQAGSGIRILRQDLFETIISFIITQQNNIPRIRGIIERLCMKYGRYIPEEKNRPAYFAFPEAGALAEAGIQDLEEIGLGYRAKYIRKSAQQIEGGEIVLDEIASLGYDEAKKRLLGLYGVGTKVAECICLFARHDADAFPVDVHIRRMLAEHYPDGFPFSRYRGYAGILQQYIFYRELEA